jgi:uncharacterized protein YjeT (DUF2065 family)
MERTISPGLRNTFLVHAFILCITGLTYLFFPVLWGNLTGCLSNEVPQVFRIFGVSLLGLGVSSILAYRATSWEAVKIVAQMECFVSTLFVPVIVLGLAFWNLPSIAWMYLVLFTGFAVAFDYFYLKNPVGG